MTRIIQKITMRTMKTIQTISQMTMTKVKREADRGNNPEMSWTGLLNTVFQTWVIRLRNGLLAI